MSGGRSILSPLRHVMGQGGGELSTFASSRGQNGAGVFTFGCDERVIPGLPFPWSNLEPVGFFQRGYETVSSIGSEVNPSNFGSLFVKCF